MAKKLHWTQTPEGKKKMSESQLAHYARRREAAGLTTADATPSTDKPRTRPHPWNYGKKMPPRKVSAATRKAIADGLRARQERLAAVTAASNGHGNGLPPLEMRGPYAKTLAKAEMRRYAIMGMKQELADLERRREVLIMAIGKE